MRLKEIEPRFVEYLPDNLEEGLLYVSMEHAVASHRCACGCGSETVTPISPTDWQIYYDGRDVSISPSIGNWNFPCRSHYWIDKGKIRWASHMSEFAIDRGREKSQSAKKQFYREAAGSDFSPKKPLSLPATPTTTSKSDRKSFWADIRNFISF